MTLCLSADKTPRCLYTRRPRGVRPLPLHPELWKTTTYAILCLRVQVGQESRPCCGDRTVAVAIAQKRQPPAHSQLWVSGMVHPVWEKKSPSPDPTSFVPGPRSPRREHFLQTFWSWEVFRDPLSRLVECEMTFRCLNPSQFKGSRSSSPSSSLAPRGGSLEERVPAFVSLSLPGGFELACFRLAPVLSHDTIVFLRTQFGG